MKYFVTVNGRPVEVDLVERLGRLHLSIGGREFDVGYDEVDELGQVVLNHAGRSYGLSVEGDTNDVAITLAGHYYSVKLEDERERAAKAAERAAGRSGGVVTSVMPGVVVEVLAKPGTLVAKGDPLLILSAMKMQNEIGAPIDGTVKEVHVTPGTAVSAGAKLVTLTPAAT